MLDRGRLDKANRAVVIALLIVLTVGLVQLVPLPRHLLSRASPATDAFLQAYDISYVLGAAAADPVPEGVPVTTGTWHPLSIDPRSTLVALAFLAVFALFLTGLLRDFSRRGPRWLVTALVAFGAILALIGIIQKTILGDDVYNGMRIYGFWQPQYLLVTPFGPFVNRNHFAGWMVMVLPLAIGYLCALLDRGAKDVAPDWRNRVLWISSPEGGRAVMTAFAIVVMGFSLAMSMSRSGMACFVGALTIAGWQFVRRISTRGSRFVATLLFVALLAVPALWLGVQSTVERFAASSASIESRAHAWRDAVHIVRAFPLAGTGLNTYGTATVLYQTGSRAVHYQQAHNDYLQLLAEGGFLLGLPVLATILFFMRAVRLRFREGTGDRHAHWIRMGAVTGLLAIALQSLVEFSLQMPGNAALFVVLSAVALHRLDRPERLSPPAAIRRVPATRSTSLA